MKALLFALALLLPPQSCFAIGDGAGLGSTQPRIDQDPTVTPGTSGPAPGGSTTLPQQPLIKPKDPPITPGGQETLSDFNGRLQRGERVDPAAFFRALLQSEAQNAPRWIEWMSRIAAQSGGGDPSRIRHGLYQEYVGQYPDDPSGYSGLGKNDFNLGNYGAAVADYTKAIELGAVTPENLYGRGLAAERAGDYELAHQDSGMAMSIDPKNRMAESLYKLTDGRISKVYVDLTSGLLKNAARREGQGDRSDTAVSTLGGGGNASPARAQGTDPKRLSASLTYESQRLLRLGDFRSALDAAQRASALNPSNAQALNLLATAYERLGMHDEAVNGADGALQLQPDSVAALNTRAWARSGLKRFADALEDAGRAIELDPSNAFGYLNKARALGGMGRYEEMLDAVGRTASLDPRFASLRDRALQLAPSGDTELLFAGAFDGGQPQSQPQPQRKKNNTPLIMLATLAGGFLMAFGLIQGLSPAVRQRITSRLLGRSGGPGIPAEPHGPLPMSASPASEDGDRVPGFELKRVLATGGMGLVYEAVDEKLGRRVAIKKLRGEIRDDPKERGRFLQEARTVGALRHPNIVQIHSVEEQGPDIYLVFEFVEGRPLEKMLSEKGPLPWPRVMALLKGICAALDHAHAQGVIHRDLKPSNIMVETSGGVKVMDFGVARQVKEVLTRSTTTRTVWGTPCYMSPEAEEGKVSRAADIYSLGVCVYEMATGEVPFEGAAGAMFAAKAAARYLPASTREAGLPKGIDEVLSRALSPDPSKRQVSAMQLLTELRALG